MREARALGREVIDRCNLTILFEPGQEDTAEFLAAEGVKVVASLPCYTRENVDAQRGKRVFERSIAALQPAQRARLCAGPGAASRSTSSTTRSGPRCPRTRRSSRRRYRRELREAFGIEFHRLVDDHEHADQALRARARARRAADASTWACS